MGVSLVCRAGILFLVMAVCCAAPTAARFEPEEPPEEAAETGRGMLTLTGDGMTMIIRNATETGVVSGDIQHDGKTYPFSGQFSRTGTTETVKGTFKVKGKAYRFQTRQRDDEPKVTFITGGKTYMLAPVVPEVAAPDDDVEDDDNPLGGSGKKKPRPDSDNPLDDDEAAAGDDTASEEVMEDDDTVTEETATEEAATDEESAEDTITDEPAGDSDIKDQVTDDVEPADEAAEEDPFAEDAPQAAAPLLTLAGDGLTVRVMTMSADQTTVTGDLALKGKTYPFTGRLTSEGDVEMVKGTFRVGNKAHAFTTRQPEGSDVVTFVTGGRKFELHQVSPNGETPDAPAEVRPPAKKKQPARKPQAARPARKPVAGLPEQIKLRKVEFRDINMANVVAYTMLVPDGWKAEGHIEWSNDKTPYPQKKITITAPDGSGISFIPAMTFHYSEATQVALQESAALGVVSPIPERQGVAPPEDLGAWLVSFLSQNNQQVSNVELVEDKRDTAGEKAMAAQARASGVPLRGAWQMHLVTIRYERDGVPFTEEIHLSYARLEPVQTRNINMWDWMLFVNTAVRAPAAKFEQMKSLLYASAYSLRTVPQWWTQQQLLLMQITQNNHVIGMEEIKRRGQYYSQMSDDSYAAWKKEQVASTQNKDAFIDTINEVEVFRDTDGLGVKLPIHYKNYYSDGKGNYLMTNTTLVEPGIEWSRVEPMNQSAGQ